MAFSQIHKLLQSVQRSTEIQRGLRPAKVLRQIPQPRPPDELQLAPIMTLTIVAWCCMGLGGNHAFHKYDKIICVAWFHMIPHELFWVGLCRVVSPFASGRQSLIKSAALMLWQRNVCILHHPFGMFLGKLLQDDGSMVQTMLWLLYVMPWDPSPLILNTPY